MGEFMYRSTYFYPRQLHTSAALSPGKSPGTHWIRPCVGPRTGLANGERRKTWFYQNSNSDPSAFQSIYRLWYHASRTHSKPELLHHSQGHEPYCDMTPERSQRSTAETSIARQRLVKTHFRSNGWARNNRRTVRGGDLYSFLPEVI
jgi:hypothetical protein